VKRGRVEGAWGNREVPPRDGAVGRADLRGAIDSAQREGGPRGKQEPPRSGPSNTAPTGVAFGGPRATELQAREVA
jgi:hypothetical protein